MNELYYRIVDEMHERFEYLEDTVRNSDFFQEKTKRKKSTRDWRETIKSIALGSSNMSLAPGKLIDISDDLDGVHDSDEDVEDLTQSQREDKKLKAYHAIKESDSVQRAMIDLHRRSKLLNNFAIMNSTGFVKIIKKFDKTFPSRKGMFKQIKANGFICGDGKEVSDLSDKMVGFIIIFLIYLFNSY